MADRFRRTPGARTPWLLAAACAALVIAAGACSKSSSPVAPPTGGGTGGPGPPASAVGDSARWAVMDSASVLYFQLKSDPNRESATVSYLLSNPNVAYAGVSDSLGNVWACFDNDRTFLLIDNRTFTGPSPALALRRAPEQPLDSQILPLGTELPVSKQARLMNSLEPRWHSSVAPIASMLATSGYVTNTPASDLAALRNVHGDGVFYWGTHCGVGGDLQQNPVFGVWTQTLCDSAADRQPPLSTYWANKEICWAATEVGQPDGSVKTEFHYGITQYWIRHYMDFDDHSIVYLDGCSTAAQELRDAFFNRNAGIYCGWDRPSSGSAWIVTETFFDLLTGSDYVDPQNPSQRPFLFDWVRDWMVSNGKNIDPNIDPHYGQAHLYMNRNPASPVTGLLRPTIDRIFMHDSPADPQDWIEIEGDFGLDPGAANREVKIAGQPLSGIVWGEHLITANLPLTAYGDVTVSVRGHLSNVAHLTRWLLPMRYMRFGPGSLAQQIDLTLVLRGDASVYRPIPYANPTATPAAIFASKASTGSFIMSGIYQPDPDHYTKWIGSGSLAAATNGSQLNQTGFLHASGNISGGSRTIITFSPGANVQYLIETEASSSPGFAGLIPFGTMTLSYDANWVIKADSLPPMPTSDGTARLRWGPASPDASFNNGGR